MIFEKKQQAFKFKYFSTDHLNTNENGSFSRKQKRLICILNGYNGELHTGPLSDVIWSSFRPELAVGSQYLLSWDISDDISEDTGFLYLPLVLLHLVICSNKGANLKS